MADEELEPLFDYSRVQPINVICLDEDDHDENLVANCPPRKKKKVLNSAVKEVGDSVEITVIGEDEEDWLLPPPKEEVSKKLNDDSILKALRLKKKELESFAKSAENVVQAVEESVRKELQTSLESSLDPATAQPLKPQVERNKVVITLQDKEGAKQFRIYVDDKFERLFKMYADKVKADLQSLVFSFDGDKIGPAATPESLGMEDDDIVEVSTKKR